VINATVRVILEWIAGLWAAYGLVLLVRIIYGLSTGRSQASPDQVQNLIIPVVTHLGIPLIALVLIRRDRSRE